MTMLVPGVAPSLELLARRLQLAKPANPNLADLPRDIERMIWQTAWRTVATERIQRAYRTHRVHSAWKQMRGSWYANRYVLKYMAKTTEPYVVCLSNQLRNRVHAHALD